MSAPIEWFHHHLKLPVFSHADILSLSEGALTSDTVQNWANRGLITHTMIHRRRSYDALEVAKVCLAPSLIRGFDIGPQRAMYMILRGLIVLAASLGRPDKITDLQVKGLFAVYGKADGRVEIVDEKTIKRDFFDGAGSMIVIPLGRMLLDLATRAMILKDAEMIEAEREESKPRAAG